MTTTTTPGTGLFIAQGVQILLGYAEGLLKDIPADRFHEIPVEGMTHPAHYIGHLAIYPDRVLEMLGHADRKIDAPLTDEVFGAAAQCVPQDGRYPEKDVIVDAYMRGYGVLAELLPQVSEDAFASPNSHEPSQARFPQVGSLVSFLCGPHNALHLGQVSAWRRVIGLGPST